MSTAVLEEVLEKVGELTLEEQAKVRETIEQNEREAERQRRLIISSQLKGKYKLLSSVGELIARKEEEIEMEDKGWRPK